jgi:membrane associated rhomboid family serine protease
VRFVEALANIFPYADREDAMPTIQIDTLFPQLLNLLAVIRQSTVDVAWVLAMLWVIQLFNAASNYALCALGIMPRHPLGLIGIPFAPFIHAGYGHLFFNSVPLFLLLTGMLTYGLQTTVCATLMITLFGGVGVWLFGRKALHVGASGLIMGYMGFILYNGYYAPTLSSWIVAVVSFYYLGSILFSIVPSSDGSSWEGHLFGFLAGVAAAYYGCLLPFVWLANQLLA